MWGWVVMPVGWGCGGGWRGRRGGAGRGMVWTVPVVGHCSQMRSGVRGRVTRRGGRVTRPRTPSVAWHGCGGAAGLVVVRRLCRLCLTRQRRSQAWQSRRARDGVTTASCRESVISGCGGQQWVTSAVRVCGVLGGSARSSCWCLVERDELRFWET